MICQKCQSEMNFREGTSKAGKPYAGNFCSNKECDHVEWQETKPQPDRHEEIMNGIRQNWKKLDNLENLINAINAKVTGDIGSVPEGPSNIKEDSE